MKRDSKDAPQAALSMQAGEVTEQSRTRAYAFGGPITDFGGSMWKNRKAYVRSVGGNLRERLRRF
jgi:hypothetical protein